MLAASRYCLYSSSRRTSSCRGSSSSSCDLVLAGQHHPRLDFDQRAGHVEKIADRVDVDLLQHGQVFEKLVGDGGDRNVRRVELVLAHEVQQQVQRTAKDVQLDAKLHATTSLPAECANVATVTQLMAADCSNCRQMAT